MHSRKKGKSGSIKPVVKTKSSWLKYDAKEIEQLVVKLAKEGNSASKIGLILRDSYGIPDIKAITNKKITKILQENNLTPEFPEEFKALIKKELKIIKHLETNKKDMPSKRGLQLTESKIKRLMKYYKKTGKLPKEWKYDREKIKLLIG
jgi:small subunit ribosomal protein S15